jgi:hypothetical protein
MTDQAQRYAKVPADMSRASWHRNAGHVATAGEVTGRGTSQAAALADLGSALTTMASRASDHPAFWADDQGGLWVVIPDALTGGSMSYRVSGVTVSPDATAYPAGSNAASAEEAHATAVGMTRIPRRY